MTFRQLFLCVSGWLVAVALGNRWWESLWLERGAAATPERVLFLVDGSSSTTTANTGAARAMDLFF